jgi:hypothetical protein
MAKYNIAGRVFTSQQAILDYVAEIKGRYGDLEDLSPADLEFMVALLGRHPAAPQKIGSGVRRMWVQANPLGSGRGFVLERLDGTTERFSPKKCVLRTSRGQEVYEAFRRAVDPQIAEFRRDYFRQHADSDGTVPDPLGFGRVTKQDCHVDHGPLTFRIILDQFLAWKGLTEADVALTEGADHITRLADKGLEEAWVRFHKAKAKLRITSRRGNTSAGAISGNPLGEPLMTHREHPMPPPAV